MRICVTGPESTGKTTLAQRLAAQFGASFVPEAARLHAERTPRALEARDVEPIARGHLALAEEAERGARMLVLDTDLLSTVVYARHYYGCVPAWVLRAERARRAGLYLLCDVDVPWLPDGVRDRPDDRAAMFDRFRVALRRRAANVVVVRGSWGERWRLAEAAVEREVARPTSRRGARR